MNPQFSDPRFSSRWTWRRRRRWARWSSRWWRGWKSAEGRDKQSRLNLNTHLMFKYQGCTPRLVPQGIELPRPTPQKLAKAAERGKVDFNLFCLYLLTILTRQTYTLSGNQLIYALLPRPADFPPCPTPKAKCSAPCSLILILILTLISMNSVFEQVVKLGCHWFALNSSLLLFYRELLTCCHTKV